MPTHVQEQEALRKETLDAFNIPVDGEDDGLFSMKTVEHGQEEDMEDEAYRAFLLGNGGGENGIREALGLNVEKREEEDDTGVMVPVKDGKKAEGEVKKVKKSKKVAKTMEEEKKKADEEFLLEYVYI